MIQLNKNYSVPEALAESVPVKVVSVGGVGLIALDGIVLDGLEKASVVAINTDVQSLTSSVAAHKVSLGGNITRGLGTGGDPELGYDAAVESADEIREALADARMIFVCAGLGGGTGSGAAPYVARLAREAGALVIGFVTLPFTFEGKRRNAQARDALARLSEVCHSVICFENDRMGDLVSPQAGIHQAFAMADATISQSVRSVVNLIQRPGLIRIGFDDLLAALRTRSGRSKRNTSTLSHRFISNLSQRRWNQRLLRKVFRLRSRWRRKRRRPPHPFQANPSRTQLRVRRKWQRRRKKKRQPKNPCRRNRKLCNSSLSRGDDLKKVSRRSSRAKTLTSPPICG